MGAGAADNDSCFYGAGMGKDGVSPTEAGHARGLRHRAAVVPQVRWSADAGGKVDGDVLLVGMPFAALAAAAACEGEDRGGPSGPDG
ncbi:hypothetical protein GCM10010251_07560 [Streptomyces aurantiogriseus]|uniref:Uncharacterized protein n=1 Tax=Streptomyces aurantiogriseus TaxID=66870 RepID=A0A918BW93_9ACTN|nr:hypothetical protein GCM10010251_07560 [Streptomyces aurantiogriseus]